MQRTQTSEIFNVAASLRAFRTGRAPDFMGVFVHQQFAVISQLNTANMRTLLVGAGVPSRGVIVVVHHQVAICLHDQADRIRSTGVRGPGRFPAVDDEVSISLQKNRSICCR